MELPAKQHSMESGTGPVQGFHYRSAANLAHLPHKCAKLSKSAVLFKGQLNSELIYEVTFLSYINSFLAIVSGDSKAIAIARNLAITTAHSCIL